MVNARDFAFQMVRIDWVGLLMSEEFEKVAN